MNQFDKKPIFAILIVEVRAELQYRTFKIELPQFRRPQLVIFS
jgi:hypothetical protein